MQGSEGAQLHPRLDRERIQRVFDAGDRPEAEGFDKFEDTDLERFLRERDIDEVHVGGLALDYCVKHTALGAARRGFRTVVHLGATRPVNVEPGDDRQAIEELRRAGVEVVED